MKALLFALLVASPPLLGAEPSVREDTVRSDQIPEPARAALQGQAGRHRVHQFVKRTAPDGSVSYTVQFHTVTTGDTEFEVTPNGKTVGVYRRLEEPVGDGP